MTLKTRFIHLALFSIMVFISMNPVLMKAGNPNTLCQKNVFSMESLGDVALIEGLAGTFFGKQGSWFLMAGGSSFPEGKPWEKGVKHFSNRVFVFTQQQDGAFLLIHQGQDMPVALAEGAYASLPEGVLCAGGQTPDGIIEKVWLLSFDGSSVNIKEYPPLPVPVKNSSVALIGSNVYLVGGELADGSSSNQFLLLNLDKLNEGWQQLPDFPLHVSGSAVASQQDGEEVSLFVFGGRAKNNSNVTTFYSSAYKFTPSKGGWCQIGGIKISKEQEFPLAMAAASAIGGSSVLLYGGDDGVVFNKVEAAVNNKDLKEKDRLQMTHTGFNNKILLYDTMTDTWSEAGETINSPVAVASDFSDGENVYIVCGEIRPGVRSPHITQLYYK